MEMIDFIKKVIITLLTILGFILVPIVFYYVLPHFMPFILAFLVALLLEPLNQKLVKWLKVKRIFAANLSYFMFLGSIGVVAYFIVVRIITEVFDLIRTIERNIPYIQNWFFHLYTQTQDFIRLLPPELSTQINNAYDRFTTELANLNLISTIGSYTYSISTAIPNFFFLTLLFFISLYLIAINLTRIQERFYSYFKPSSKQKLSVVLTDLRTATIGFLQAQMILSTITYLISAFGLIFLGVKYALAIALLIVIVDILPILGTGSVLFPWAVFTFTRGNTFLAIGLVILFMIIVIVRRVIEPKVLGERIGLSALATLISIWVGFKVLGVVGIFLGPLLLILIKALVKARVIQYRFKI